MDFTQITAVGALLLALVSFIYTVHSNRANRRYVDLENLRSFVLPKIARFNGLINVMIAGPTPSLEDFIEPTKLYSEIRDTYRIYRHIFKKADRDELDAILERVDEHFDPKDLLTSYQAATKVIPDFMNGLEDRLP